jgi:hypothetical protein
VKRHIVGKGARGRRARGCGAREAGAPAWCGAGGRKGAWGQGSARPRARARGPGEAVQRSVGTDGGSAGGPGQRGGQAGRIRPAGWPCRRRPAAGAPQAGRPQRWAEKGRSRSLGPGSGRGIYQGAGRVARVWPKRLRTNERKGCTGGERNAAKRAAAALRRRGAPRAPGARPRGPAPEPGLQGGAQRGARAGAAGRGAGLACFPRMAWVDSVASAQHKNGGGVATAGAAWGKRAGTAPSGDESARRGAARSRRLARSAQGRVARRPRPPLAGRFAAAWRRGGVETTGVCWMGRPLMGTGEVGDCDTPLRELSVRA